MAFTFAYMLNDTNKKHFRIVCISQLFFTDHEVSVYHILFMLRGRIVIVSLLLWEVEVSNGVKIIHWWLIKETLQAHKKTKQQKGKKETE